MKLSKDTKGFLELFLLGYPIVIFAVSLAGLLTQSFNWFGLLWSSIVYWGIGLGAVGVSFLVRVIKGKKK